MAMQCELPNNPARNAAGSSSSGFIDDYID
jgi:hypothetical protein